MKRKQCMEEEERFFSFFSFFSVGLGLLFFNSPVEKPNPPRKKNENSHVRLLLPLHALRLGDPAAQLHPARVPREQRVRPAQPDAAVVGGEERRRERPLVVIFGSCCSRRRRSCSVDVSGAREGGGGEMALRRRKRLSLPLRDLLGKCRPLPFFFDQSFQLFSFFCSVKASQSVRLQKGGGPPPPPPPPLLFSGTSRASSPPRRRPGAPASCHPSPLLPRRRCPRRRSPVPPPPGGAPRGPRSS